jgi:acyl-CoA thioesterase-1
MVLRNLLMLFNLLWSITVYANAPVLMVFGDSLSAAYKLAPTEGWVSLLEQRLREQGYDYQVVNASVSGETTSGGASRLPPLLEQHSPKIIVIELGANDGLRGLNLKQMHSNLTTMIEKSKQAGAEILLLGMRIPPNYGKAYSENFHKVYHTVATQFQLPLIPFFLENVANQPQLMQEDQIHPTAEAQKQLLDNVWQKLSPLLSPKR